MGQHEVEFAPQPGDPAMGRAVSEQQHSRQRPALLPLAVCTAATRLRHQRPPAATPWLPYSRACNRAASPAARGVLHREVAVALPMN
jgi:hypothetical protein